MGGMTFIEQLVGLVPLTLLGAAVMTFGAAYIRGLTGFGMAIILVPLLGMIIRPDEAVVLAILLQLLIGPVGMGMILEHSHRSSALLIAGLAMMTTPLGLWALAYTPPDLARVIIAAIAIGAFVAVILTRKATAQPGTIGTVLVGMASGVLTGFAAMPGPPVIPYYLREAFAPQTARASMMLIFFGTAIAGTISALLLEVATMRMLILALLLFVPMWLGNWLGGKAFGKISTTLWRSFVALLLGIAGVSACWRAFA
jgi:uncharacterized protein